MAGFIREVVGSAVKSAIQEVSSGMIEKTVKATLLEIRSDDPVYMASKKLDVAERLNEISPLSEEERLNIKNSVLGMAFPGCGSKSLTDQNLTHAAEFPHQKSLEGYSWKYKNVEVAAAQLTKIAKKFWEKENYSAAKDSISLKSGRTVEAYLFPVKYAEEAFGELLANEKIYKK